MAFRVDDKIEQIVTGTGTGALTLGAPTDGHIGYDDVLSNADTSIYTIQYANPKVDGYDWETGELTYTASGTSVARTPGRSTNGNAAVAWTSADKIIFCGELGSRSLLNLGAGLVKGDGAGTVSAVPITSAGEALLDDASASDQLTTLGVTPFAKTLLDDTSAGAARATLDLEPGTDVMAYDADLAAIAGLTSAANKGIQFTGSGTAATYDLTAAGKALLDDADNSAQRTTLGLGTAAVASTGTSDGNVPVFASGGINMADKVLQRPKLLDIGETMQTVAAASTTDIDLTAGNVVNLTQNTNISTFTFSNPPASGTFGGLTIIRTKDASGTTRSIVWPTSVDWPGGTAPTLTQTTSAVDIFVFFTIDGGTRWHGAMSSADSK